MDGRDLLPDAHAATRLVGLSVATVERLLIMATLDAVGGNRTHATRMLGVSVRTLRNKLALYARDQTEEHRELASQSHD
ncbi:MAG: transcriptional regulator [Devosia sp.]|jgi:DNA-binding protein Fis|nr:transcriptional regulator [Devosia sp.]RYE44640.1 MAG: transcriptional regulator [Hyphomicrobiales bacterium]